MSFFFLLPSKIEDKTVVVSLHLLMNCQFESLVGARANYYLLSGHKLLFNAEYPRDCFRTLLNILERYVNY